MAAPGSASCNKVMSVACGDSLVGQMLGEARFLNHCTDVFIARMSYGDGLNFVCKPFG